MSKYAFRVNEPSLLVLAWLASHREHRNAVVQPECAEHSLQQRRDGTKIIEAILEQELAAKADQTHRYASIFLPLVRHQFVLVDLVSVEWALRGVNAVYFQEDALPSTPDKERNAFAAQSVTQVVQEALAAQKTLRGYLQSVIGTEIFQARESGEILQHLFLREVSSWFPQHPDTFLLLELLHYSLQHIEWEQLACWLLNLPV